MFFVFLYVLVLINDCLFRFGFPLFLNFFFIFISVTDLIVVLFVSYCVVVD